MLLSLKSAPPKNKESPQDDLSEFQLPSRFRQRGDSCAGKKVVISSCDERHTIKHLLETSRRLLRAPAVWKKVDVKVSVRVTVPLALDP